MSRVKFNFGEGGLKGFFIYHVEKCVLGVIVALVGWLILSGSSAQQSIESNLTPTSLMQAANDAQTRINMSDWNKMATARKPSTTFLEEVVHRVASIDSSGYKSPAWDPQKVPRSSPRTDPRLFAAENVQVTPLYGPLAFSSGDPTSPDRNTRPTAGEDPLGNYSVVIRGSGTVGYGGSPVEDGYGPPSAERPGAKKTTKGKKGRDETPEPPRYDTPTASSTQRTVPPEALPGIRPRDANARLKAGYANVITASVPFAKQWEAYVTAFAHSPGGQNPKRDVPLYLGVWVYRADVTDDPNADPATLTWTKLNTKKLLELEATYGAHAPELSEPEALDPKLTHLPPPFLLTDLREVLSHPDVPLAKIEKEEETHPAPGEAGAGDGVDLATNDPNDLGMEDPNAFRSNPSLSSGARRTPGAMRRERMMAGMGDSRSQPITYDGVDLATYEPVARKLVRFVDYDVKPGRAYRYRVQLVLQDPNHPQKAATNAVEDPDITSLDDKTRERIKKLEAEEAKTGRRTQFYVTTPESAPSAPVRIKRATSFHGGEVIPQPLISLKDVKVPTLEPSAKVLAVVWDDRLAAFVAAERSLQRAAVLNGVVNTEVVHPVHGDVREVTEYPLETGAMVLDIHGGDVLPGADPKAPVRAPGETLLLDRQGNLVVTSEVDDVDAYRRYVFPEPKAPPASSLTPELGPSALEMEAPGLPTLPKNRRANK